MEYYNMTEAQALDAIEFYRQRFAQVGWVENVPYPDIESCLTQLRAAGKTLMIATSKPEVFAVKILEHFGLAQYFHHICGVSKDKPRQTKADVIRMALEKENVTDLSHAVMVGDRKHDVLGAHEVGLKAIGVLYGYGDRKEHEENHADYIVENIAQLEKLLLA
jgi:phosphoglycolate phosphatase